GRSIPTPQCFLDPTRIFARLFEIDLFWLHQISRCLPGSRVWDKDPYQAKMVFCLRTGNNRMERQTEHTYFPYHQMLLVWCHVVVVAAYQLIVILFCYQVPVGPALVSGGKLL